MNPILRCTVLAILLSLASSFASGPSALRAQIPLADVGSEWVFAYEENCDWNWDGVYRYSNRPFTWRVVGTTLYEGKTLSVIEAPIIYGPPTGLIYLHQDTDRVWLYHPQRDTFLLLYDFGAQVGDTVWHSRGPIEWPIQAQMGNTWRGSNPLSGAFAAYIVDSVGIITDDNGRTLRFQQVRSFWFVPSFDELNATPFERGRIIEGIGHESGLLGACICYSIPECVRWYSPVCVRTPHAELQLHPRAEACRLPTSRTAAQPSEAPWRLGPNPAQAGQRLTLSGDAHLAAPPALALIDALGRQWPLPAPQATADAGAWLLDLPAELAAGVYSLRIRTESGAATAQRLWVR